METFKFLMLKTHLNRPYDKWESLCIIQLNYMPKVDHRKGPHNFNSLVICNRNFTYATLVFFLITL